MRGMIAHSPEDLIGRVVGWSVGHRPSPVNLGPDDPEYIQRTVWGRVFDSYRDDHCDVVEVENIHVAGEGMTLPLSDIHTIMPEAY